MAEGKMLKLNSQFKWQREQSTVIKESKRISEEHELNYSLSVITAAAKELLNSCRFQIPCAYVGYTNIKFLCVLTLSYHNSVVCSCAVELAH